MMSPLSPLAYGQQTVTRGGKLTGNTAAAHWAPAVAGGCIALLAAVCLLPGLSAATQAVPLTESLAKPLAAGESLTGAYLRFLAAMVLVIGIMLVLYALLKKRFSLLHNRGDSHIRVLETRPLAPRKSLCLVEVSGEEFLLGLSQDGISLLAALGQRHVPANSQPDGQLNSPLKNPPQSQSFDSILKTSQESANQTVSRAANRTAAQP